MSEKTGRQITEDPEVRYLMESFGGDYVQTVSFWRMCVKAKDNPALTAEQKAKVGLYANYAAVYIQENGGFRGADPAPATVTFDEITALIERQKNLDVPAADNRLLNYYSEAYTLGLFSVTTTEITSQASQQNTLKQFLQTKGVTEQNAQKFANEFFKVGTIYRKGSTDGLLHVEISGKKAVFIGGKWREVYDVKNSGWTKTDRDYDCYQRTVDGVTYYYLPEYRCFLTGDMNPPANKIDFAGSYNNGTYIPPKYPITKMATLTSVDIPVAVSDGLIQFFESQPRFSS